MLGPHAKFNENSSCAVNNNDKNIGARVVVDRGIINNSLLSILSRSATIWNAPLRPIILGPIRLWANAKSLRSDNITNKDNNMTSRELNKIPSDNFYILYLKVVYEVIGIN